MPGGRHASAMGHGVRGAKRRKLHGPQRGDYLHDQVVHMEVRACKCYAHMLDACMRSVYATAKSNISYEHTRAAGAVVVDESGKDFEASWFKLSWAHPMEAGWAHAARCDVHVADVALLIAWCGIVPRGIVPRGILVHAVKLNQCVFSHLNSHLVGSQLLTLADDSCT